MDGVVFRINGQQRNIAQTRFASKYLARRDHRLFVREAYRFACLDGGVSRFQSGDADDRRDDKVYFRERRNSDRSR